jgi:hypothetical protein
MLNVVGILIFLMQFVYRMIKLSIESRWLFQGVSENFEGVISASPPRWESKGEAPP